MDLSNKISRRELLCYGGSLLAVALFLPACKKSFVRPAKLHALGPIDQFLFTKVYLPERKMMIYRDDKGWSALSTRCTLEGCDLSYQDTSFFCPCCRGEYDLLGRVIAGKPSRSLPWYEMSYNDGRFFADSGKPVRASYRFTTPQLEKILSRLKVEIREQRITDVPVSNVAGKVPRQSGNMFTETDPNEVYEGEMIK